MNEQERSALDAWITHVPNYFDDPIVNCEICGEPYHEDDHCENPLCTCQDCGEPLPEQDDAHCQNCCECETCLPDRVRYYLPDTLGLPRDFDIARIKPSRITLELAAADHGIAEKEDLKPFIRTLLDWTEECSWIYTSQALINRGYTEFAKDVTATARELDEITN